MRRICAVSVLCLVALAALAPAAGAVGHKPATPRFKCPKGFMKVKKTVTRHGKKKVVFRCKRDPASVRTNPVRPSPLLPGGFPATPVSPTPAKQASTTTLGATYQDLPPEKKDFEFKVGQYTLVGAVSPFAVPDLRCNGTAGCLEPAGSLAGGPLVVPLMARINYKNFIAHWEVGVAPPIGLPAWFPVAEAADGSHFFQANGAPDPSSYLPSSARAPVQIAPHLPGALHRESEVTDNTIDENFKRIASNGSYNKIGGTNYDLVIESNEGLSPTSAPGCKFQVRINTNPPTSGTLEWDEGVAESVFANRNAGSYQIETWVRHEGAGTAKCGLNFESTYVIYERPHV